MNKNGTSSKHENKIETKITGITAFSSSETFLKTSYDPNKTADIRASNNHMRLIYWFEI